MRQADDADLPVLLDVDRAGDAGLLCVRRLEPDTARFGVFTLCGSGLAAAAADLPDTVRLALCAPNASAPAAEALLLDFDSAGDADLLCVPDTGRSGVFTLCDCGLWAPAVDWPDIVRFACCALSVFCASRCCLPIAGHFAAKSPNAVCLSLRQRAPSGPAATTVVFATLGASKACSQKWSPLPYRATVSPPT